MNSTHNSENFDPEPRDTGPKSTGGSDTTPGTRIRVDCAYDGAGFHGWARQPNLVTVQGEIETGLKTLFRRPVGTVVAGRTDAGVHARHQVFHLDLTEAEWVGITNFRSRATPETSLVRKLNGALKHLGGAVHIMSAARAPLGFDARFSPTYRRYSYRIADTPENFRPLERGYTCWLRKPVSEKLMSIEADTVLGLHDFLSFCKPKPGATTVRELHSFTVRRDSSGIITAELVADAFCHNMVRALIGACLQVGEGSRAPGWLGQRLHSRVRDSQVKLAPAQGLVLEEVGYPDETEMAQRASQTRALRPSITESEPGAETPGAEPRSSKPQ